MKLLLDTHVLLWSLKAPEFLRCSSRDAIADESNEVAVSVVSGWELAIKQTKGKLELSGPASAWLPALLERLRVTVIGLDLAIALRAGSLPLLHNDPFDRALIAHALERGYTIITNDDMFARYGVAVMRA